MAQRKNKPVKEEVQVSLGPQLHKGEIVFGVAHNYASVNDTFVNVTFLSGKEIISRVTGSSKVKADRDEVSPYAAMLAALKCTPRPRDQVPSLSMKIGRIKDVTPIPSGSTYRKGVRHDRRL